MTSSSHRSESTAGGVCVALELSAREWSVTISPESGAARYRTRVRPGDAAALQAAVAAANGRWGVGAAAPVWSCYEAGRDGFWVHRFVTALGWTNVVVDSSSIEVPRRLRRAKTDRLDGEKLLRLLQRDVGGERGVWQVVHVPTVAMEDARQASRSLTTSLRDRTRCRNRVRGLLAAQGVTVRLDAAFPARLAAARDWAGAPVPPQAQARILATWRVCEAIEAERRAQRTAETQTVRHAETPAGQMAQRLTHIRGIGVRTATILTDELFSRHLRNRREVGALAGFVSAPYHSGTRHHDQGLTRSGIPAIRRLGVEVAWAWLRFQPQSALTQWYQTRFGTGGATARRIGIVALARRVIIALWRYATTGVVPEGTQLTA